VSSQKLEMSNQGFFHNLWNKEVKPDEKYRGVLTSAMIGYACFATFYGMAPLLGRIREVDSMYKGEISFFSTLLTYEVLFPLFLVSVGVNFFLSVASYTHQKRVFGNQMPMDHAAYQLSNLVLLGTTAVLVLAPAFFLILFFGWELSSATDWMGALERFIVALPGQLNAVPTMVHFPAEIAFLSAAILSGFGAYWWHRIAHTWRPMWMLIHRPHHIPSRISQLTSVITDDVAIGLLTKRITLPVVQVLIAKLFTHDSTSLIEITAVWFLLSFAFRYALEPVSHSIVFYDWAVRHKWIKLGCFAFFSGPYHLMHHSDKKEHQVVNVSFTPFYVWDILFGTYVNPTEDRPVTGLTNSPEIYMNPFRIIFSGWVEMYMEFKLNKHWKDRFLILFGSTSYIPPIRVNYLKKDMDALVHQYL
jgi:sterol desaturase/sphingolipid hydroxylase (fatty acid hydroxylase superfamily)